MLQPLSAAPPQGGGEVVSPECLYTAEGEPHIFVGAYHYVRLTLGCGLAAAGGGRGGLRGGRGAPPLVPRVGEGGKC